MSVSAYRRTLAETETPRDIERRVLSRVTAELLAIQPEFDPEESKATRLAILNDKLREPLNNNLKIWATLKRDLIGPGNQLSEKVRADLISLAIFVEHHTVEVLAGRGQVQALIDINKPIIEGLSGVTAEKS
ncbi:flagellar biosynthesis regulator FlaF [Paracoccus litorisediminis]|uniref:flagellar biosynthesis regulator FlaF n=1 Tax=Paracoccus litorisediminis TaxID=2006130 RepID=UPI00372EB07D